MVGKSCRSLEGHHTSQSLTRMVTRGGWQNWDCSGWQEKGSRQSNCSTQLQDSRASRAKRVLAVAGINNGQWPPAMARNVAGHQENFTRKVEQRWDRLHRQPAEALSLVVSKTRLHTGNSPLQTGDLTRRLPAVPSRQRCFSKYFTFWTTFLYGVITTVKMEPLSTTALRGSHSSHCRLI